MKKIIVIETSDIGCAYTKQAINQMGFEELFLCDLKNYQGDTLKQINQTSYINTPTNCADELLKILEDNNIEAKSLAGVITFLDSRLEVASDLALKLNVPGHEKNIFQLKDKSNVMQLVPEHSPLTINFDINDFDYSDLYKFSDLVDSFIIKPRKMAGGIGVLISDTLPKTDELLNHCKSTPIPNFLSPTKWVIQEFIKGDLVSVEGYIFGDDFRALGISSRTKIKNTECMSQFPIDDQLPLHIVEKAHQACKDLLLRSEVKHSYFHIELIFNDEDCFLIDGNVGRLGGGGIGELLALSYDLDPSQVYQHVIELTLFNINHSPYERVSRLSTSICYGIKDISFVEKINGLDSLPGFHTQILDVQQKIPAMGSDNWSWLGIATGVAPEIVDALKAVQIQTQQGEVSPCF
ncbi:MAG: ATP-grasp domain-containing protein [Bdellovibrionales bacterium]|nr:ATP-grasp domain-containing protein [Bdellovibrionales bacterium]